MHYTVYWQIAFDKLHCVQCGTIQACNSCAILANCTIWNRCCGTASFLCGAPTLDRNFDAAPTAAPTSVPCYMTSQHEHLTYKVWGHFLLILGCVCGREK
jgi:hypothetical protein